ncbi:coiled-coil domain-containing protein R3HCC1L isoform X2 [Ananas comosus]|uniref:Coiled-coil domain-containing protein R3HCC1L isoform X2 n=1 Tax=Ananas comosus TaxID=4615 RepID=A0A6P5GHM1_ANACO|nr:coiled-coil domain-containing protein R3HCC1L isoform X2 [Ananas comosus]
MDGGGGVAWTDEVEDLVDRGDVDGAISVLEAVVARLEAEEVPSSSSATPPPPPPLPCPGDLGLAAALGDLAELHASRGFSLKADELRSRALALRARADRTPSPNLGGSDPAEEKKTPAKEDVRVSEETKKNQEEEQDDEDDWEAIVDRGAIEDSLKLETDAASSKSTVVEEPVVSATPKRRGRGSFLYDKSVLYSDHHGEHTTLEDKAEAKDKPEAHEYQDADKASGNRSVRFGTSHVLVVYDFPPSTRTTELEKIFEDFRDRGVAIRWVNDTVALAVFRTPSVDLEPPYPRPKTSARTAQRLIAQVMGIRPTSNFGSAELKKQEEARKNRIVARQTMRDEAWGSDKS